MMLSCFLLTGPRPGTKNLHSVPAVIASATSSFSIAPRASEKVFFFRDASFRNPTFVQGRSLFPEPGTASPPGPSTGNLSFCKSFTTSSPSSEGSTMGLMASAFILVAIRSVSSAKFRFLRVGTCAISGASVINGNPRGLDRGFDLEDLVASLSRDCRFTGDTSRLGRFRGGGTFLGWGEGSTCGWSEWFQSILISIGLAISITAACIASLKCFVLFCPEPRAVLPK
mmetsp:Transcript_13235/g.37243  ORF Transcript_13235/g.37243 Transcript_13235/m.37243 type:complete len:227 (-) Transcript_13235:510-1190(-)